MHPMDSLVSLFFRFLLEVAGPDYFEHIICLRLGNFSLLTNEDREWDGHAERALRPYIHPHP